MENDTKTLMLLAVAVVFGVLGTIAASAIQGILLERKKKKEAKKFEEDIFGKLSDLNKFIKDLDKKNRNGL